MNAFKVHIFMRCCILYIVTPIASQKFVEIVVCVCEVLACKTLPFVHEQRFLI